MVARLFILLRMRKILLAASLTAAATLCSSAQEVARVSDFEVVPSVLTASGKAVPVGIDEEKQEFTIFDGDFNVVKKFNYKMGTCVYRSYYEIATVVPTGAKVTNERSYDFTIDNEPVAATTLSEMKQKLKEYYGDCEFYGFTDYKGRTSCWSSCYSNFYEEQWLGTTYPRIYWCIVDGMIMEMNVDYNPEFNEDAIANAEWTISDEDLTDNTYNDNLGSFEYLDYDENIGFDESIHVSQTLFNDDDKWEYLMPKRGAVEKSTGEYRQWDRNSDGIVLRRSVYEEQPIIGLDIVNEDGDVVAFLNPGSGSDGYFDIYKIAGNLYTVHDVRIDDEWVEVIYKYDPKSTDIKEVGRSKANMATLRVNGRSITVEADGQDVDGAELFDMGGRKLATSGRRGTGNIILKADNAADGVYSVALKRRGRIVGAQKIVLK